MRPRNSKFFAKVLVTCVLVAAPLAADPASAQGRSRGKAQQRGQPAAQASQDREPQGPAARQQPAVPRGYEEPAFARGYDDGYRRGLADGKSGQRYDPADSRQYRNADQGYVASYGLRDAYRNNYRTGFRQGYEEGYRSATR